MFRGTPHYPQRAKSSILTILTSHSKATQQNPPALLRNSTAHSAVVILTTQLLSRPIWQYPLTQQHYRNVTFAASSKASLTPCNTRKYQRFAVLPMPCSFAAHSRSDVSSTSILYRKLLNILARWNRTSGKLEIRVPVLGNRLFCAWWLIHFCWDIGQDLAASAVRSSLYQCFNRNYDSVCTKSGYKKWFPYHRTADIKPSGIFKL